MIAILFWELKRRRTAIVWWTIGSIVLAAMILFLYPSIRDQAQDLNQVINQLPAGLRELKAGASGNVNVADPVDFLNSQLFYATLPILWIILSITRGASVLGRDEQEHTLELLLARPVRRGSVILGKGLSLVAEFVVIAGLTMIATWVIAPTVGLHVSSSQIALATLYTALFSLSFGLIAFALQAASSLTKRAAAIVAVLLSFGGYIVVSMAGLTDWLTGPAKLFPYSYFAPDAILRGTIPVGLTCYLVGIGVACGLVAYLGFRRRDIA